MAGANQGSATSLYQKLEVVSLRPQPRGSLLAITGHSGHSEPSLKGCEGPATGLRRGRHFGVWLAQKIHHPEVELYSGVLRNSRWAGGLQHSKEQQLLLAEAEFGKSQGQVT